MSWSSVRAAIYRLAVEGRIEWTIPLRTPRWNSTPYDRAAEDSGKVSQR